MNENEMIELVGKSGKAILEVMDGYTMTGDEVTTFWATLVGNVSEILYRNNCDASPVAACVLTSRKLRVVAIELSKELELKKELENGRKTKGKKL